MDILDAIARRRSVRAYADRAVSRATVERLIDAAIHAPSAVNRQPWHFTVIQDRALLDTISSRAKQHMLTAIDAGAAPAGFREHLSNPQFQIFYQAPAMVLISGAADDDWVVENIALAAENLMLAAYALGIGSCWIGFAQRWLETKEGSKSIDLPSGLRPIAPIIIGYPSAATPPVPRNPATIHWIG